MITKYLLSADCGNKQIQSWVTAESLKDARKAFWSSLDDDQRNSTQSIECIDEQDA